MKPDELKERLDRYGADLSRWPTAERAEAELLLQDKALRAEWQAAKALDAFMTAPVAPPSRALLDRVLTLPQRVQPATLATGWDWLLIWLRPASAAAVTCSLIAGVWVGPATLPEETAAPSSEVAVVDDTTYGNALELNIPGLNWSPGDREEGLL